MSQMMLPGTWSALQRSLIKWSVVVSRERRVKSSLVTEGMQPRRQIELVLIVAERKKRKPRPVNSDQDFRAIGCSVIEMQRDVANF